MALATCRECAGKVSTEAATCPHCGVPDPLDRIAAKSEQERTGGETRAKPFTDLLASLPLTSRTDQLILLAIAAGLTFAQTSPSDAIAFRFGEAAVPLVAFLAVALVFLVWTRRTRRYVPALTLLLTLFFFFVRANDEREEPTAWSEVFQADDSLGASTLIRLPSGVSLRLPDDWVPFLGDTRTAFDSLAHDKSDLSQEPRSERAFAANLFDSQNRTIGIMNVRFYPEQTLEQSDIQAMSAGDLGLYDEELRKETSAGLELAGSVVTQWSGTKRVTINGLTALLSEYRRPARRGGGIFRVRLTRVMSGPRSFTLTASYLDSRDDLRRETDRIIGSLTRQDAAGRTLRVADVILHVPAHWEELPEREVIALRQSVSTRPGSNRVVAAWYVRQSTGAFTEPTVNVMLGPAGPTGLTQADVVLLADKICGGFGAPGEGTALEASHPAFLISCDWKNLHRSVLIFIQRPGATIMVNAGYPATSTVDFDTLLLELRLFAEPLLQ